MNSVFNLTRGICRSRGSSSSSQVTPSSKPPSGPSGGNPNPSVLEQPRMNPSALDRIFLTWSGQFKTKADIPASLPGDVVLRARTFARIRINLGFLLLTAIGCGIAIKMGKSAVAPGESLETKNLEWHRKVNEEYKKSQGK